MGLTLAQKVEMLNDNEYNDIEVIVDYILANKPHEFEIKIQKEE